MKELQIRLAEGRGRPQVEYALRYPATESGNTPFDRYRQPQIHLLRRQLWQEQGRFPTKSTAEWQPKCQSNPFEYTFGRKLEKNFTAIDITEVTRYRKRRNTILF